jgi:pimeloyl-ACP methyl ester carboxylesterase
LSTFVFVHGAAHGAWCWSPLLAYLEAPALALDLPGRGKRPGDLATLTAEHFADSVAADIEGAGLSDVILVGHSMAGLTLPRVAARIPERLERLVFVSCAVPPDGTKMMDILDSEVQAMASEMETSRVLSSGFTEDVAKHMFCNDMDEAQTQFVLDNLCPEAPGVLFEAGDLAGLAHPIPRTYVRLLRDQSLSQTVQDGCIAALGEVEVIVLDTGHNVMISDPAALARLLNGYLKRSGAESAV